ncbi:D-glycero-D-manno-heptose 1-phosphate guanosyltransferase [Chitiniphilus shinanonensis]|uniref:D-glycero-D-manno-heptose 1-phosphate guanosyltransferase n=1 Tax=Chitiniphilus shinanonensis TaxID=553088 RepID=A0ABQ6BRI8_9NEIS|nr:nucleotidyltransferase family protein [Chitiniphilus shinanonensis]GLS03830.1 D-glycero-D-manno-heptose 1-phosphate guanosyltransferase [Chitiniphilus shinanonensis]
MEAIVLAGGKGTRLREVVSDVPKPMAPISGQPFLALLLNHLAEKGISRVVLSIGYMAQVIQDYFGETYAGLEIDYVVEPQPLGTGGAVRLALEKIRSDHVFIFNGDTFLDLEISEIEALWIKERKPLIVGREVNDTSRYGRLLTEGSVATGFTEKGVEGPGLINGGCYVLQAHQLDEFLVGSNFSFELDFLAPAVKQRQFGVFITHGKFIDIGIPEDFHRAQIELSEFLK